MNSPAMVTPSMTNLGQPSLGNSAEKQGIGYQNRLGPNISQVGFFIGFETETPIGKWLTYEGMWDVLDDDKMYRPEGYKSMFN